MIVLDESTAILDRPGGGYTFRSYLAKRFFVNDAGEWESVVPGQGDKMAGNCQFVPIAGGYRLWKPNPHSSQITNPEWTSEDYWLEVVDTAGADVTFGSRRTTVSEQVRQVDAQAIDAAWNWTNSPNLTRREVAGVHEWVNAQGEVVFQKRKPLAWSEEDPEVTVEGLASVDAQGNVTITWGDLSGLAYPRIKDPLSSTGVSAGDGFVDKTTSGDTWSNTRNAASGGTVGDGPSFPNINFGTWVYGGGATKEIRRVFLPCANPAIPSGTVDACRVFFWPNSRTEPVQARTLHVTTNAQASLAALAASDYGTVSFVSRGNKAWALLTLGAYNQVDVDPAAVSLSADNLLGFLDSTDLNDIQPATDDSNFDNLNIDMSEGSNPMYLEIDYTPAGPSPEQKATVIMAMMGNGGGS